MSKTLILSNGKTFEFLDNSTMTAFNGEYTSFAKVDEIRSYMTVENLTGATLDDELMVNYIPVQIQATTTDDGVVHVSFFNRLKTSEEILNEKIIDLEMAVAELAEGE